jgi:hypothetical protein
MQSHTDMGIISQQQLDLAHECQQRKVRRKIAAGDFEGAAETVRSYDELIQLY